VNHSFVAKKAIHTHRLNQFSRLIEENDNQTHMRVRDLWEKFRNYEFNSIVTKFHPYYIDERNIKHIANSD